MMKMIRVAALFLSVYIVWTCSMVVCAEEAKPADALYVKERIAAFGSNGKFFDHNAYADTYPDLNAAFGHDRSALWNHYVTHGVYENRQVAGTTPGVTAKLVALNAVAAVTSPGMSDRDKVKALHDWLINSTRYDYEHYVANNIPDISYTKEGVFLNHVAVCSGYADAFSYLSKLAGLDCEYVRGTATNSVGSTGGHAWNRLRIDGTLSYVDCTWDDPVSDDGTNYLMYDYFLISEEAISRNHRIEDAYHLY